MPDIGKRARAGRPAPTKTPPPPPPKAEPGCHRCRAWAARMLEIGKPAFDVARVHDLACLQGVRNAEASRSQYFSLGPGELEARETERLLTLIGMGLLPSGGDDATTRPGKQGNPPSPGSSSSRSDPGRREGTQDSPRNPSPPEMDAGESSGENRTREPAPRGSAKETVYRKWLESTAFDAEAVHRLVPDVQLGTVRGWAAMWAKGNGLPKIAETMPPSLRGGSGTKKTPPAPPLALMGSKLGEKAWKKGNKQGAARAPAKTTTRKGAKK